MTDDLTPRQQILLWDLISRGGSALQKDLKPEVKPHDREPLVRAKLISAAKGARNAIVLTIEEKGWNHLASSPPSLLRSDNGSKYDRAILQFVLARLQAYASATDLTYAELFAAQAAEPTSETSGGEGKDHVVDHGRSGSTMEAEIRSAFFDIAGRPARNQVRLRQLRGRLPHIPRPELDGALIAMRQAGHARFSTLSNPLDIADEEDAALQINKVSYHTIWIDS